MAHARNRDLELHEIHRFYPEFTERLEARRAEILNRSDQARAQLNEQVMDSPGDAADESVIESSADYFLHLSNSLQDEIVEISQALERLREGAYGVCLSCERPVALERLRNLPYARFCIDCQTQRERANPLRILQHSKI